MSEKGTIKPESPEEYLKQAEDEIWNEHVRAKVVYPEDALKAIALARKEGEERIRLNNLKHVGEIYNLSESFRRQFDWLKENHPKVYEDLAEWSKKPDNENKSRDLEAGVQIAIDRHIKNYEIFVGRLTDHELWIIRGIKNIITKYFNEIGLPEKGDNNGMDRKRSCYR